MIILGHLWYNSGPYFVGSISAAQLGIATYQNDRTTLPLGLRLAPRTSLLPSRVRTLTERVKGPYLVLVIE